MFNTGKFFGRTVVITGASRGIGKEIGLKLARDGANVVIAARSAAPHPKLPGTIYTAAEEIEKVGGKALPCIVDVRDEKSVQDCVDQTVKKFGGIDILINNASAIQLTGTLETEMKRYDMMHQINVRGTFMMSKHCLPYLKQGKNPHILNISPPLVMEPHWFSNHVAYTIAKYGMSMCVLGMADEFKPDGVAVNAIWPLTAVWTAAMDMLSSGTGANGCRKPAVMAGFLIFHSSLDAAYAILSRNSKEFTGNFAIDEDILREEGVTDFDKYAVKPGEPLVPDAFLPSGVYDHVFLPKSQARRESRKSIEKALEAQSVDDIKKSVAGILNPELVKKINAVYQFDLTGDGSKTLTLNLKEGSGSFTDGAAEKPDVVFTLAAKDFPKLFTGEIAATTAYILRRLKIKGDMKKAMVLDSLLKKMKN